MTTPELFEQKLTQVFGDELDLDETIEGQRVGHAMMVALQASLTQDAPGVVLKECDSPDGLLALYQKAGGRENAEKMEEIIVNRYTTSNPLLNVLQRAFKEAAAADVLSGEKCLSPRTLTLTLRQTRKLLLTLTLTLLSGEGCLSPEAFYEQFLSGYTHNTELGLKLAQQLDTDSVEPGITLQQMLVLGQWAISQYGNSIASFGDLLRIICERNLFPKVMAPRSLLLCSPYAREWSLARSHVSMSQNFHGDVKDDAQAMLVH